MNEERCGTKFPSDPLQLPSWELKFIIPRDDALAPDADHPDAGRMILLDIADLEVISSMIPVNGDWKAYWKKLQDWLHTEKGIDLTTSQVYQVFQASRLAWDTAKRFFDERLGLAFGIPPILGNLETGKSE